MGPTALLILSCAALLGCPDSRCSLENCQKMESACRAEPGGMPNVMVCRNADGGPLAGFDYNRYCPTACNAGRMGKTMQCVVDQAGACIDAGHSGVEVVRQCTGTASTPADSGSPPTDTCWSACEAKRKSCESACPQNSFEACMDCSANCGLAYANCGNGCT